MEERSEEKRREEGEEKKKEEKKVPVGFEDPFFGEEEGGWEEGKEYLLGFETIFDYGLWANHFFFVGSILFVLSPFFQLQNNKIAPIADLGASLSFVIGAPFYFVDWILSCAASKREFGNELGLYNGGIPPSDSTYSSSFHSLQPIDWYFYSNIFYAIASFADLATSLISLTFVKGGVPHEVEVGFDFMSSHSWAVSGICTILGWYFQTEARKYHSAPVQYTLSPWFFFEKKGGGGGERGVEMMSFAEGEGVVVNFGEEEEKERDKRKGITYEFDWTGLGDWFFLPAGVAYAVGSYVCIYSPSMEACLGVQLLGAVGYLLDAIFYYPGLVKEEEEEGGEEGEGEGKRCLCL